MSLYDKEREEDLKKIEYIKKKYDISKEKDLLALYSAMQTGQIVFSTNIGTQFDNLIYQKVEELKKKKDKKTPDKTIAALPDQKKVKKAKKKIVVLTKKELLLRRCILSVLFLISVVCLGYFGLYYYGAWKVDKESKRLAQLKENTAINNMYEDEEMEVVVGDEVKTYKVLEKYKSLYNSNKTLIGWLKIADTVIDYPIMQSEDNTYYLDHNSNLEEDRNGALFLDSHCDIQNPGANYIIYGHNMKSGKMFGSLDQYEDPAYYEKHKTIQFDTLYEEGTYEVMYVFRSHVFKQEEVAFKYYQFYDANSKEEFESNMNEMAAMSLYDTGITAQYGDQLLTLSTCDYEEKDGRFVVVAKRIN